MKPTIREVIEKVAEHYEVDSSELIGPRRWQEWVRARHIAMYLAQQTAENNLSLIGRVFHRDHTTVMHAVEKVEASKTLRTTATEIALANRWVRGTEQ